MNLFRATATWAVLPLAVLLGACAGASSSATGQVTGQLMSVSGGRDKQPMAGPVAFTAPGKARVTVQAGASGIFSAQLPPGRYQVSGPCSQSFPVTVTAGQIAHVTVYCIIPSGAPPAS